MDLSDLREAAALCKQCELHKRRVVPVFSKGNPESRLMLCGMCPGPDENKEGNPGLPFVGRAGQLLDKILEEVELTLDDVYITNMVKCYLKPGIPLQREWTNQCMQFIMAEIAILEPKVVVALGADAARAMLSVGDVPLSAMRLKFHNVLGEDIKMIATYHPSYFLRGGGREHPHYHRIIEDLQQAKGAMKNV